MKNCYGSFALFHCFFLNFLAADHKFNRIKTLLNIKVRPLAAFVVRVAVFSIFEVFCDVVLPFCQQQVHVFVLFMSICCSVKQRNGLT